MKTRDQLVNDFINSVDRQLRNVTGSELTSLRDAALDDKLEDKDYFVGRVFKVDFEVTQSLITARIIKKHGAINLAIGLRVTRSEIELELKQEIFAKQSKLFNDASLSEFIKCIKITPSSDDQYLKISIDGSKLKEYFQYELVGRKKEEEAARKRAEEQRVQLEQAAAEERIRTEARGEVHRQDQLAEAKRREDDRQEKIRELEKLWANPNGKKGKEEHEAKMQVESLYKALKSAERSDDVEVVEGLNALKNTLTFSRKTPESYKQMLESFNKSYYYALTQSGHHLSPVVDHLEALVRKKGIIEKLQYKTVINSLEKTLRGIEQRYKISEHNKIAGESKKIVTARENYNAVKSLRDDLQAMSQKPRLLQTYDNKYLHEKLGALSKMLRPTSHYGRFVEFIGRPAKTTGRKEVNQIIEDIQSTSAAPKMNKR